MAISPTSIASAETFGPCINIGRRRSLVVPFKKGSVVYSGPAALAGYLKKVAIKGYIIHENVVVYEDTLNRLWDSTDLFNHDDAIALAITALETRETNISALAIDLCK
jgi:hypothetical protein